MSTRSPSKQTRITVDLSGRVGYFDKKHGPASNKRKRVSSPVATGTSIRSKHLTTQPKRQAYDSQDDHAGKHRNLDGVISDGPTDLSDDQDDNPQLESAPQPTASSSTSKGKRKAVVDSSSEDDEPVAQPVTASSARRRQQVDPSSSSQSSEPVQSKSKGERQNGHSSSSKRKRQVVSSSSSSSSSSADHAPPRRAPQKHANNNKHARPTQTRIGKKTHRHDAGSNKKRKVVDSDQDGDSDIVGAGSSQDSDDVQVEPRQRAKPHSISKTETLDDEEESDEDDLSISGKETIQASRLRQVTGTGSSSKFAALRALREQKHEKQRKVDDAKRRGIVVISDSDENDELNDAVGSTSRKRNGHAHYLGSSSRDHIDDSDGENEATSSQGQTRSENDTDEMEQFIVSGGEESDDEQVVAKFREKLSTSAQGQTYYLKTVLQWMVHCIVCPDVDWLEEDETFRVAEKAVSGRLQDLLRSLVGSSAWTPAFSKALHERPEQNVEGLDMFERGPCFACSMGKSRHASLRMTFQGQPYDRKTFQPIEPNSDDDDGDSDNEQQLSFDVGSSCAGRAQVYHELHHWAYTTYQRMAIKISSIQRMFPKTKFDGLSKAEKRRVRRELLERDRQEADRCAVIMDAEGTISDFAKQLDEEIKRAVNAFARAK
ncbi:hypothetical protein OIO90_003775 [Microbotryomycetes sp. JL221]|nr:hypothetical protein OIO90_003775 [Microbotryomycetes sp. JL221]